VPLEEGLENLGVSAMAVIHTNQVYRTHLEQIRDMRADESVPALVIVCLDDDAAVASFSRSDVGQIDRRIPEAKTRLVLSASKSKGPDALRAELVVRGIDWQDDCADLSATAIEAIIAVENARRKKPPSQFKSRLQAPVSSSVDVSKAGASGDIVWIAMLQQIPGVGADMAAAIANRYPTLPNLLRALDDSITQVENTIATLELKVRSKQGTRKIGPAVASRISRVFTATSQDMLVN
ncbi:Serine hydroxymethyltransferase, cytosolic, variant 2, partial [Perkinsus olseni]